MLEIKPVKSYKLPRYPQGSYYETPQHYPWNLVTVGVASTALLALLGCSSNYGVVGPPPLPPKYITESEARIIINQVFAQNGIQLDDDVPYSLVTGNRTIALELDGFNEQLKLGYEYISSAEDWETFTPEVVTALDEACASKNASPCIEIIQPTENKEYLENAVQEFIAELRSTGVL